jgi:hypothetical protein
MDAGDDEIPYTRFMKQAAFAFLLVLLLVACAGGTPTTPPVATPTPGATSTATLPPDVAAYLDNAIALMEEKSIYSASTDWEQVRSLAALAAAGAQSTADLYPVLLQVLSFTGDRHGYIMQPGEAEAYFEETPETIPPIQYELVAGRVGAVTVPTFVSGSQAAVEQFIASLQAAIRTLDASGVCGWVLDLRYNEGGNGFAMLAGVAPLLEQEGVVGYYVHTDGSRTPWRVEAGDTYLGDAPMTEFDGVPCKLQHPGSPVAVLTNEVTISAGEFLAIAFHGWSNTRSFGQETFGRTTAPEGFFLEDGAVFAFSTAWFGDHSGEVYPDSYVPEVRIPAHDDPIFRDRTLPAQAIEWLLSQPACAGGS